MLALTRKDNQYTYLTQGSLKIAIKVYECRDGSCKLAIEAPKGVIIMREEVYTKMNYIA